MSAFQERIKSFRELPVLKSKLEDLKLKIDSLEKIKNSISEQSFSSLTSTYQKELTEITEQIKIQQTDLSKLDTEIELDCNLLGSETSILEKELQEQQLLFERGALGKVDYDQKCDQLKSKIKKNKKTIEQNLSYREKIKYYATHIGTEDKFRGFNIEMANGVISKFPNVIESVKPYLPNPKVIGYSLLVVFAIIIISFLVKPKNYFEDSRDGQKYKTVKIGTQVWLAENFKFRGIDQKGKSPEISSSEEKEIKKYGKYYNWNSAVEMCPAGWHLPSVGEFNLLLARVGSKDSFSELLPEGKSGFNAILAGSEETQGDAAGKYDLDQKAFFWTSTEVSSWNRRYQNKPKNFIIYPEDSETAFEETSYNSLYSVRYIKNDPVEMDKILGEKVNAPNVYACNSFEILKRIKELSKEQISKLFISYSDLKSTMGKDKFKELLSSMNLEELNEEKWDEIMYKNFENIRQFNEIDWSLIEFKEFDSSDYEEDGINMTEISIRFSSKNKEYELSIPTVKKGNYLKPFYWQLAVIN